MTNSLATRALLTLAVVCAAFLAGCKRNSVAEPTTDARTAGKDHTTSTKDEGPARTDRAPVLSGEDLASLWDDLAAEDAARAYRAIVRLTQRPEQSVPFLKARLRPVPDPDATEVARFIAALDAEDFAEREKAQQQLAMLGSLATPALKRALEDNPSPEARRRLTVLLEQAEKSVLPPQTLRTVRAIEALERIGTPEARAVLAELASGVPASLLTQEAQSSLDRLDHRSSP